jgi:hypothetical protein
LIPLYGEQNTECLALKKKVAELNSNIKEAIHRAQEENKDIVVDGWKCSLTVSDESEFNEDKLIEFCKKNKIDVVRTKEVIDGAELERLIYNGLIDKDILLEMDKCKDTKTKETLRCVRVKDKEED